MIKAIKNLFLRFGLQFPGIYHTCKFIYRHHRIPTRKPLFNDKIFYKKIENPTSLMKTTTDKQSLKDFVRERLSGDYFPETYAIWSCVSQVNFDLVRYPCCIKPTHSSGQVIFMKEKPSDKQKKEITNKLEEWLSLDYFIISLEPTYQDLKKRIIVEELLIADDLRDYKFFCVDGTCKAIQLDIERHTSHTRKLFDVDWNDLGYSLHYPWHDGVIPKPSRLSDMVNFAEKLSRDFDFVRVDMYLVEDSIFVGELTHTHGSAGERFIPSGAEKQFSEILFGG